MNDRFENCWKCGAEPRVDGDKYCVGCRAKLDKTNKKARARNRAMSDALNSVGVKRCRNNPNGWE